MNKKNGMYLLLSAVVAVFFMMVSVAVAADKVVVVPLFGSAVGNATASDVVKGKTFSSRAAGKGVTGTLELHPMGQSYTNSIGMTFNLIPAGTFTMGSPPLEPSRYSDEETQHQVTLTESFYMQITEVTNGQWDALIVDTGLGDNPSTFNTGDNYPV